MVYIHSIIYVLTFFKEILFMKTAIIYYSKHHHNTEKLLNVVKDATSDEVTLIDVTECANADLSGFDRIGFASGIYYSKFDKRVLTFAKENTPENKDVFFMYTYGAEKAGYTKAIRTALEGKNANVLGEYGCLGFNTFGPFKFIGGIAKNHPTAEELDNAVKFYNSL